jgi:hypothetical protein
MPFLLSLTLSLLLSCLDGLPLLLLLYQSINLFVSHCVISLSCLTLLWLLCVSQ